MENNEDNLNKVVPNIPYNNTRNLIPNNLGKNVSSYGTFKSEKHNSMNVNTIIDQLKTIIWILLWYCCNVLYNIDNKLALKKANLPWTISTIQFFVGYLYFGFLWLTKLRKLPKFHSKNDFITKIFPQGICQSIIHFGAVVSMGMGAISFTHIIKSGEPVVTAILSFLIYKQLEPWPTYLSMLPVIIGISLASSGELTFSWASFFCAMTSNFGGSVKSIIAKRHMKNIMSFGENLTPENIFSCIIIIASICSFPIAIAIEYSKYITVWNSNTSYELQMLCFIVLRSGIWYYAYNEISYICLSKIDALSHSLANTFKRVFIIFISVVLFNTKLTTMGFIGATLAIVGAFFYSYVKIYYTNPPACTQKEGTEALQP